jgi:hypothetical protein
MRASEPVNPWPMLTFGWVCAFTDSIVQARTRVVTVEVRTLGGGNTAIALCGPGNWVRHPRLVKEPSQANNPTDARTLPSGKAIDLDTWR